MRKRSYNETGQVLEYVPQYGGYYHNSLPGDPLRTLIDTTAEYNAPWDSRTKKITPEKWAPSQFSKSTMLTVKVSAADRFQPLQV